MGWIYEITGLDLINRNALGLYYARLPDPEKVEAHRLATDLGRQHHAERQQAQPGEYAYAMLLLALSKMRHTRDDLSKKSSISAEQMRKITELRIRSFKAAGKVRKAKKQQTLDLKLYSVVRNLRLTEEMSWRDIAAYLGKHHKLKITHVWLMKTYNRLNNERKKRGENGNKIPS